MEEFSGWMSHNDPSSSSLLQLQWQGAKAVHMRTRRHRVNICNQSMGPADMQEVIDLLYLARSIVDLFGLHRAPCKRLCAA